MGWKRLIVFLTVALSVVGVSRTFMHQPAQAASQSDYNVAVPHDAPIPQEALRLRIIANSDSAGDQELKREVRDAVVVQVGTMLKGVQTSTEARQILLQHVPELQQLAQSVVRKHGYTYQVQTELGKVPFPTKIYGNQVYPAGDYEALRIIIGKGQGQNWWCVLFPPLCFVDIATGDAVPNTGGFPDLPPIETVNVPGPSGKPVAVQVRSMAVDYGEELWRTAHHWFGN